MTCVWRNNVWGMYSQYCNVHACALYVDKTMEHAVKTLYYAVPRLR